MEFGLRSLQQYLGLVETSTPDTDVLFVALDFENCTGIQANASLDLRSQLGVAILDTGNLATSQGTPSSRRTTSLLDRLGIVPLPPVNFYLARRQQSHDRISVLGWTPYLCEPGGSP